MSFSRLQHGNPQWESNRGPLDSKSNALPLSHHAPFVFCFCCGCDVYFFLWLHKMIKVIKMCEKYYKASGDVKHMN